MSSVASRKTSPVLTVIAAFVILIALLVFLIWAAGTLSSTAATSSNDIGLMFLRIFGFLSPIVTLLMVVCAIYAFVTSFKESRRETVDENTQVIRFMIIGAGFVIAAIMIGIFALFVHTAIL
jgi:hypothetical protein